MLLLIVLHVVEAAVELAKASPMKRITRGTQGITAEEVIGWRSILEEEPSHLIITTLHRLQTTI